MRRYLIWPTVINLKPRQLITTVDEVERRTGFDFFSKLSAAEQSRLESAAEWSAWK